MQTNTQEQSKGDEQIEAIDLRKQSPEADKQESWQGELYEGSREKISFPDVPDKLKEYDEAHDIAKQTQEIEKQDALSQENDVPGGLIERSRTERELEALTRELEIALGEGLEDQFLKMDFMSQKGFKEAGENLTEVLKDVILNQKIERPKIMDKIRLWLKMIPNVNNFFIEQETKNRADKIMAIKYKYA